MRVFGDYIITKEIGEGGMGRVYRAWKISDAGFRKLVAIKTLKSTHNTDLFINEAKISARFDDENIVKTINFGKISGEFFIEMEYIRGINLKELMETVGEIPLDVFFYIAEKLLTAVSYIHRFEGRGLVHRDVNPKNILISWIGGVKLSDFGITLPQNSEIDPFGKISYVPPEVILGRDGLSKEIYGV
jgi:Serine/threonine protein kinase